MFCFTVPFSKTRSFYDALRLIEFDLQVIHTFRDDLHAYLIVSLHYRPSLSWEECKESFRVFRDHLDFDIDNVHESDTDQKS